jgi:hypothetical protein
VWRKRAGRPNEKRWKIAALSVGQAFARPNNPAKARRGMLGRAKCLTQPT